MTTAELAIIERCHRLRKLAISAHCQSEYLETRARSAPRISNNLLHDASRWQQRAEQYLREVQSLERELQ